MRKYLVVVNALTQADGPTEEVIYVRIELQGAKYTEILGKST